MSEFEIKNVDEHFEVFRNGQFMFSADTIEEARRLLLEETEEEYNFILECWRENNETSEK
jgi:hypothetical protein